MNYWKKLTAQAQIQPTLKNLMTHSKEYQINIIPWERDMREDNQHKFTDKELKEAIMVWYMLRNKYLKPKSEIDKQI